MPGLARGFQAGNILVEKNLILAPMDGYSSWPFRSLCRELGSGVSYTEFVKAEDVLDRPHHIEKKLYFLKNERPVFFQLYGHDPKKIVAAALYLQEREPDAIDINLGCPNRTITSRGAGAGLMRTPLKIARIFKNLARELDIPTTAKIRLGWKDCQNQLLIARIIEENGGALVAVHARTKEQGHQGDPDLSALAEIKNSLNIPVIGNGGVSRVSGIQTMQETTGCDGVMIGRGAIQNPWIFSKLNREDVPPNQVQAIMLDHLDRSLTFYGQENGLILFRKFASNYLAPYSISPEQRRPLLTETDPGKFIRKMGEIFAGITV
ncbi:MAG: tRNA-dihydrouridine synthase family protein [Anaerolineales bacterium]|nr:tRNA-dihydrouridine synthase family protein [Anaerolineales bacterium]